VPNSGHTLFVIDLTALLATQVALLLAIHMRLDIPTTSQVALVSATSVGLVLALLYACGSYRLDVLARFSTALGPVPIALPLAALLLMLVLHYVFTIWFPHALVYRSISRCATVALIETGVSLVVMIWTRALYIAMARQHWFRRRLLVLGTGARAAHLYELLNSEAHQNITDLLFIPESMLGSTVAGSQVPLESVVVAGKRRIDELAAELGSDGIVIALDERRGLALDHLLKCKTAGVPVMEYDSFLERETGRVDLRWLDLAWLVYSPGFHFNVIDDVLKRTTDIVVSLMLLIISFPMMMGAMIAILLEDGGPIFYRQTRATIGNREFSIFKLRTMRTDAERAGAQWACVDDPRITRVGAFLRKSRLDEIPQLINVLMGDMSLVGPRPERPQFVEMLAKEIPLYQLRHNVRAGVTGWAQINYPYGASVDDARCKLEYDLYYIKNYSFIRDLSILLQTFRTLVLRKGGR
jgi:sugar transferase (PEP-CTERM system associated)